MDCANSRGQGLRGLHRRQRRVCEAQPRRVCARWLPAVRRLVESVGAGAEASASADSAGNDSSCGSAADSAAAPPPRLARLRRWLASAAGPALAPAPAWKRAPPGAPAPARPLARMASAIHRRSRATPLAAGSAKLTICALGGTIFPRPPPWLASVAAAQTAVGQCWSQLVRPLPKPCVVDMIRS